MIILCENLSSDQFTSLIKFLGGEDNQIAAPENFLFDVSLPNVVGVRGTTKKQIVSKVEEMGGDNERGFFVKINIKEILYYLVGSEEIPLTVPREFIDGLFDSMGIFPKDPQK